MQAPSVLSGAAAARLGLRRLVIGALVASLSANVLLAGAILLRTPPVLTILVPPGVTDPEDGWRFTERRPDPRYLERHALSLVATFSNLSPRTMDAALARLLAHVDPEREAELGKRLSREMESLRADNASVVFHPWRTRTNADALTVEVLGERRILIGSAVTSERETCYRLAFRHEAGRVWLASVSEVPPEEAGRLFPR